MIQERLSKEKAEQDRIDAINKAATDKVAEEERLEAEREEVRRRVFWKSTHNGDSLRSSLSLVTVAFSSLTPF